MEENCTEQQSVGKNILRLTIPSFVAQLVFMLYNIVVQIYFIGRILFGLHGELQEMFGSIGYVKSAK